MSNPRQKTGFIFISAHEINPPSKHLSEGVCVSTHGGRVKGGENIRVSSHGLWNGCEGTDIAKE